MWKLNSHCNFNLKRFLRAVRNCHETHQMKSAVLWLLFCLYSSTVWKSASYHGRVHRLQHLRRTVDTSSSDRTGSDLTTCIRSSSCREERWTRLFRSDVIEEGYEPSERLTAEVESVTSSLPSEVDYIIIGSGIGGLTCGALLRYYGYSVLVLESHYAPGGVAHTFERQGFKFDAGPSLWNGMSTKPYNPLREVTMLCIALIHTK